MLGPRHPPLDVKSCPTGFFCGVGELFPPIQNGMGFRTIVDVGYGVHDGDLPLLEGFGLLLLTTQDHERTFGLTGVLYRKSMNQVPDA